MNAELDELWKQLAEAKEVDGFLNLPATSRDLFPQAEQGKLLARDSYKTLMRIIEQRSGIKLVSDGKSCAVLPSKVNLPPSASEAQQLMNSTATNKWAGQLTDVKIAALLSRRLPKNDEMKILACSQYWADATMLVCLRPLLSTTRSRVCFGVNLPISSNVCMLCPHTVCKVYRSAVVLSMRIEKD